MRAFASEYGCAERPTRFVAAATDLLLSEQSVAADPAQIEALRARQGQLITVELPIEAKAVFARHNVRILSFGPESNLSVALLLAKRKRSWARGVRARRILAGLGADGSSGMAIPRIVAKGSFWMVEEQLAGGHIGAAAAARCLETALHDFYATTVRMRPFRGARLRRLVNAAERLVPGLRVQLGDALWPVALCQGDLNPSNLLDLGNDRFGLVDWESAEVVAIALDLVPLVARMPSLVRPALDLLRRLTEPGAVPPEVQLLLGLAWMALRHEKLVASFSPERRAAYAASKNLMMAIAAGGLGTPRLI
jgi:hypothetical protein